MRLVYSIGIEVPRGVCSWMTVTAPNRCKGNMKCFHQCFIIVVIVAVAVAVIASVINACATFTVEVVVVVDVIVIFLIVADVVILAVVAFLCDVVPFGVKVFSRLQ